MRPQKHCQGVLKRPLLHVGSHIIQIKEYFPIYQQQHHKTPKVRRPFQFNYITNTVHDLKLLVKF